jgi:hypothetical protein
MMFWPGRLAKLYNGVRQRKCSSADKPGKRR